MANIIGKREVKYSFGRICRDAGEEMLQLLYPRVCPLCGNILNLRSNEKNPYICRKCYGKLNIPEGQRCIRCSRPVADDGDCLCEACSKHTYHYDSGISLMLHDNAAKKILYDLKYSNKRDNADMLAYETALRFKDIFEFWKPDVMIPVPLHRKRYFTRGFNQAELLARRLSSELAGAGINIPVDSGILMRTRNTSVQKELGEQERSINIRGAFEVSADALASRNYTSAVIVDDIYTSGATVSEAAGQLKKAGITKVHFLTFSIVV